MTIKRIIILSLLISCFFTAVNAQKYFTRSGLISFSSEAPLEKIEGTNQKATAVLDASTGKMEFAVLIKAFQFEKALMQEHFNENYMESDQYPKSKFKGQISNFSEVNFSKDGTYPVTVKGDLSIHGVTQSVSTEGTIDVKKGQVSANASFDVAVADYKISIPAVVRDNIAKIVTISINISKFEALNK